MASTSLANIVEQAKAHIACETPFAIINPRDNLAELEISLDASQIVPQIHFQNVDHLLNAVLIDLRSHDLRTISYDESQEIRKVVDFTQRYFKSLPQQDPDLLNENWQASLKGLSYKVLSAKCGGIIRPEVFANNEEFRTFIEVNSLQHQFQALRFQISSSNPDEATIPFFLNDATTVNVKWSDLNKEPIVNGDVTAGYRFSYQGQEVLRTDLNYKIHPDFTLLHNGINTYNAGGRDTLRHFDERNPAEWKRRYFLDIYPMLRDLSGNYPASAAGDHTFVEMRDAEGRCYSIGDYPDPLIDPTSEPTTSLFSARQRSIRAPDWYSLYPVDKRNLEKFSILLSQNDFDALLAHYQVDRESQNGEFTPLTGNCSSYQVQSLKEVLGIELDSKLRWGGYLIRRIFPKWIQDGLFSFWDATVGQLPEGVQKALYFFPLYYIPSLVFGLLIKILSSSTDEERTATDITIFDLVFRPWNFYFEHPVIIREHLREIAPNGILCIDTDEAGRKFLKPYLQPVAAAD
jgi:hypothetical protein